MAEKPTKSESPEKPHYKYMVGNIAEDLNLLEPSVRVLLRKRGISKNKDGVYGWNNQADYKAVLSKLRGEDKAKPKAKGKAEADDAAE